MKKTKLVEIDEKYCKGCGLCVAVCRKEALRLSENVDELGFSKAEFVEPENCVACLNCFYICPEISITVYK